MSTVMPDLCEFWGFSEAPFANHTDPRIYFESRGHEEAQVRLRLAIEKQHAFTLLTGDFGTGKTLLWNWVASRLDAGRYVTGQVVNPLLEPVELLREISFCLGWELKGETKYDVVHGINDLLQRTSSAGRHIVLAIDEAHLIPEARVFEELRMLLNYQPDYRPLITVVLLGQTELSEQLKKVPPLAQRLELKWHLPPLDPDETEPYIHHRLREAGGPTDVFDSACYEVIATESRGNPREINRICDLALTAAAMADSRKIDLELLQETCRDLN